ncbi:MAG: hypothetical protein ABSG60_10155 [Terracidiphilus sp.]|jgi:hypothetical protein
MVKKKAKLTKRVSEKVFTDNETWTVQYGELKRGKGRPGGAQHLFNVLGEKLPFTALQDVKKHVLKQFPKPQGVYVAHDSMGCPRYIGRGNVFARLESRWKAKPLELCYFSFYLVSEKKHEREIETLLIRAAGFLLEFNEKKKRVGISHGNINDYEAGTFFYERQRKKGKRV